MCGTITAGGGGCASASTEGGVYCKAPSTCASAIFEPIRRADPTIAASTPDPMRLCIIASLRTANGFTSASVQGRSNLGPLFDFPHFAFEFFYFELDLYCARVLAFF